MIVTAQAAGRGAVTAAAAVAAGADATRMAVQAVIKTADIIPAADCNEIEQAVSEPVNGSETACFMCFMTTG